jgi:hypothetical protein
MRTEGEQMRRFLLPTDRTAHRFAIQGNGVVRVGNQGGLNSGRQDTLNAVGAHHWATASLSLQLAKAAAIRRRLQQLD